jgi:type VI protein secretion system component VasF
VKKYLAWYLIFAMFIIGIVPRVEAAFTPSQAMTLAPVDRAAELQRIQTVLETKLIQQRLQDLGYTGEEIRARLSQLSDQQLHSIAQKLDDLRVGKDGLGIVIALLVIVILVVILVQLSSGHKITVTP